MVAHFKPNAREAETGESQWFQVYPFLYYESQVGKTTWKDLVKIEYIYYVNKF